MENIAANPGRSFYDKASWYLCVAPVAALVIGFTLFAVADRFAPSQPAARTVGHIALACELVAQLGILVFGLTVCCKIRQHRRRLTIWLAILGLLVSFAFGAVTLLAWALNTVGPG